MSKSHPQESQLTPQEIQLIRQLAYQLYHPASEQLDQLWLHLQNSLASQLEKLLALKDYWFPVEEGVAFGSCFDFCISALKYAHEQRAWEALLALTKDCGFIFSLKRDGAAKTSWWRKASQTQLRTNTDSENFGGGG